MVFVNTNEILEDNNGKTELVTVTDSKKRCPFCQASKIIRYEMQELYKRSYCYKCTSCRAFAIEGDTSFTLTWFQDESLDRPIKERWDLDGQ